MLELKPVDFMAVQHWMVDFQKKSKCFEIPPEEAGYLGIYIDGTLYGYYALIAQGTEVTILHGYLAPAARHKDYPRQAMHEIEQLCKQYGYTKISLCTSNRFKSYLNFMQGMGYKPEQLIFSKEV